MTTSSQQLFEQIVAAGDKVAAHRRRIDAKLGEILPGLKEAIDKSDGPAAETYAAALEHEQEQIQDALEQIRRIVSDLQTLKADKAFVAKNVVVLGTAAKVVSKLRDELTKLSEDGDTLLEKAELARKRSLGTAAHAQRGLAQLRMWLRQDENFAKETHDRADKIMFAVFAAVEARDEAALAAQQKAFDLLPTRVRAEDPQRNRQRIGEWAQRTIGKGLGAEADRELQSEAKELRDKVDEMERRWIEPLGRMQAKVMAAVIAEIDARKAAAAMGIDAALAPKLAKLLNDTASSQLERALETWRKANKLPGTGREMLAALRRAKLVR